VKRKVPQKEFLKPQTKNFTAFPKENRPKNAGLGYVSPSHNFNSKNVTHNYHVDNAFQKFGNDMMNYFRNYMCRGMGNSRANAFSPYPQRRKKTNSSRSSTPNSTRFPMPKEKSKKGIWSKYKCDANLKEPNWQWVPKQN
jgi:hypothetical protein